MSERTSHRRRARQNRTKQDRAGIIVDCTPVRPGDVKPVDQATVLELLAMAEWHDSAGMGPCEKCHTVEAETRFGDLLVCGTCRASFPVLQPWRICPESGEALDTRTGKPLPPQRHPAYGDGAVL